jgi:hypothetical protein
MPKGGPLQQVRLTATSIASMAICRKRVDLLKQRRSSKTEIDFAKISRHDVLILPKSPTGLEELLLVRNAFNASQAATSLIA